MKKNELAKDYERFEDLKAAYDEAEKAKNEAGMNAARAGYQKLLEEVRAKGETYSKMMRLYSDMKERGNDCIDFADPYLKEKEIVDTLKDYGFGCFTLSSTWSGAVENAWNFQQVGCTLESMIEINGSSKEFMSDSYEKVHAFLFRIA